MVREMKDSGIEWIGKIPASWTLRRLQWCLIEVAEKNDPIKTTQILSLTNKQGVLPYEDKGAQGNKAKENLAEYKLAYEDTLIVNSMNVIIGSVGISHYFGCVSPVYYVFKETNESDLRFINYIFNTVGFQKECRKFAKGILEIRLRISTSDLFKRPIPLPNIEKQRKIADYLDKECAEIDAILEKTHNSIDEYKKLKQAIITQAVTKGVRGDRPMKESGIEWVPMIPADWDIIPSKRLFADSDERKRPDDELLTASQKYGVISQQQYMEREKARVVLATQGIENWKHVEPYDFIISLRSFQGGLEMSEVSGCITWHYIVLKPLRPIHSFYFKWLFKSKLYIKALQRTCNFIRDGQDLRYSNFVQVPLFIPPMEEQKEIADALNIRCAEIDALIQKKVHFISELESYKKSLIYEYVTGKKEI